MEEEKTKWLESLKVGSYVGIEEKYSQKSLKKVVRLSDKMIFLEDKRRFWKNGRVVGADIWNRAHLVIPTQEFVNSIRLKNRAKQLEVLWNKTSIIGLGVDKIEEIIKIIESKPHGSASQSSEESLMYSVKREPDASPNPPKADFG